MKKDHVEIFKGAIEEDEVEMEAEVQPTPNCTGKKRERYGLLAALNALRNS